MCIGIFFCDRSDIKICGPVIKMKERVNSKVYLNSFGFLVLFISIPMVIFLSYFIQGGFHFSRLWMYTTTILVVIFICFFSTQICPLGVVINNNEITILTFIIRYNVKKKDIHFICMAGKTDYSNVYFTLKPPIKIRTIAKINFTDFKMENIIRQSGPWPVLNEDGPFYSAGTYYPQKINDAVYNALKIETL